MVEIAAALGVVLAILVLAAGGTLPHATWLLLAGGALLAVGLVAGVAAGIAYHVALYRALAPLGLLRPGWWWRPTSLHGRIPAEERPRVMPWFHAGAAGFFVALAGCAVLLAAVLAM